MEEASEGYSAIETAVIRGIFSKFKNKIIKMGARGFNNKN